MAQSDIEKAVEKREQFLEASDTQTWALTSSVGESDPEQYRILSFDVFPLSGGKSSVTIYWLPDTDEVQAFYDMETDEYYGNTGTVQEVAQEVTETL
jgi:hypothetical protein